MLLDLSPCYVISQEAQFCMCNLVQVLNMILSLCQLLLELDLFQLEMLLLCSQLMEVIYRNITLWFTIQHRLHILCLVHQERNQTKKNKKKNIQSGISEQSRGTWSVKPIYSKVDKDKVSRLIKEAEKEVVSDGRIKFKLVMSNLQQLFSAGIDLFKIGSSKWLFDGSNPSMYVIQYHILTFGATNHCTANVNHLASKTDHNGVKKIFMGDGTGRFISFVGQTFFPSSSSDMVLKDLLSPKLSLNLPQIIIYFLSFLKPHLFCQIIVFGEGTSRLA